MMAKYSLLFIILSGILLFPLMVLTGLDNQISIGADKHQSERRGFLLPQKHKTSLTREEQRSKVLYEYYCALCHGKRGEADGFNSFSLSVQPTKHSSATLMATLSDAQIHQIIREGGAALGRSPQMPPWGGVLTDQEISNLTVFIRTLAEPSRGKKLP